MTDVDEKAPAPPATKRSWKQRLWRVGRLLLLAYVGLSLVLAAMQTYLIFPGAASQGQRHAIVREGGGTEVIELKTPTGEKVVAMFGGALTPQGEMHPEAATRPTLVYFYGNGMCMADCAGEFMKFRRRGFNVMVPEFLGYGMSGGKPSEAGVYATADAAFDHLLTRADVDKSRIVPMGWSLGAAAAIHLASTRKEVPCVVNVSAFTSMDAMARKLLPFMPTGLVLRHHFDNETKVKGLKIPIFLGHGTRDGIIPFEMSKKLSAAAGGKVVKYDVEGGDHNDVYDVGGTGLLDAIAQFVSEHAGK